MLVLHAASKHTQVEYIFKNLVIEINRKDFKEKTKNITGSIKGGKKNSRKLSQSYTLTSIHTFSHSQDPYTKREKTS